MYVPANANVLTFTYHTPDGWYGRNTRFVLLLNDGNVHKNRHCPASSDAEGFKTKGDAMRVKGLFVQWMKNKFGKEPKVKASDIVFGVYSQFPTYIYCGAGPSYSCTNVHVTVTELEAWRQKYESTWEYHEKLSQKAWRQRMNANREEKKRQNKMKWV
jgi:hypothetical protein